MFLVRLYLFICVNLFLYASCSIPVERLCANPTCEEPISKAQGSVLYASPSKQVLGFKKGQEITIVSKSKNAKDYWGAIIKGKFGYVPSHLIKEVKIFHSVDQLIPVVEVPKESLNEKELSENNTSDQIPGGISEPSLPTESVGAISNQEINIIEKPINTDPAYKVIEGTTIFADEPNDITPSTTIDKKSASQTVNPLNDDNVSNKVDTQDRATIPPEVINLNANYKEQLLQNVANKTNFTIEVINENDENAKIETKDITDDDDDDEEGEEDDDEEEGGGDEEDDEDDQESDLENDTKNQFSKEGNIASVGSKSQGESSTTSDQIEVVKTESTESVLWNLNQNKAQTVVSVESSTSSESSSTGSPKVEQRIEEPANVLQSSPQNQEFQHTYTQAPTTAWSMINGYKENMPSVRSGLNAPSQPPVGNLNQKPVTAQNILSEPGAVHFNSQQVLFKSPANFPEQENVPEPQAVISEPQEKVPEPPTNAQEVLPEHQTPEQYVTSETPAAVQQSVFTQADVLQQVTTETSFAAAKNASVNSEDAPAIPAAQDVVTETYATTPQPVAAETSTIFSQFSVSADSLPNEKNDHSEPSLTPEVEVETTTEAFRDTPVTTESADKASDTWKYLTPEKEVTPEAVQEAIEPPAETSVTPSTPPQVQEVKATEETPIPEKETEPAPVENTIEGPGILSQITEMFSSWFTSAPGKENEEHDTIYEAAFHDKKFSEVKQNDVFNGPPLGKCPNGELSDCTEFGFEEQENFWSKYIPFGAGVETVLTPSNTFLYLVVTAVTVLLFTLGHNFIERSGKTGPLIAKINKLEHELLVSSKECLQLKDEVQTLREKIILYENSANDELVLSLQTELEESKKVRSELESSIEVLQQELDAATEAGLDLNKMLSEVLTQKGGSESLLKSVESLQAQLDSQQKVIDEMTKKLGVKNQENEALQTALDAANDKTESLEEELGDLKHNLSVHLKEKEDLSKDLNSQINQMKTRITQLGESKEKEMLKMKKELEDLQKKLSESSGALTVKEEELKVLKDSVKHLKGKGDVKLETLFDISRVKGELAKEVKENQMLMEKLQKEEKTKKALGEQVKVLDEEMQKFRKGYEEAEQKKDEAEKKLEVLSTYFKEKETQLQKELGLQEALWAQKKGDEKAVYNMMKSLQEEVDSYKSQNETLKQEILDQERGLKNQLATLEQKAHENWVAARQAERKLEESKQELAQLRNRLTLIEKNNSNAEGKGNLRSSEELNGVEAASPILHDTSSPLLFPPLPLDPNSSSLLPPGFIPPPMFMPPPMGGFMPLPPFLPGDRRPPPLGRMSSPPLNNRFSPSSPADYAFERMSSPPLSPPGSNYRSPNEDREHFRHRTPPFPPPLHPRNWDDGNEMPGFIPISSQGDSRRDHKGSNVSSEHSSSESLDKSSRHSGRV